VAGFALGTLIVVLLIAAAMLARHHRKVGRSDTRGATRLLVVLFVVAMALWLFESHHVGDAQSELQMFARAAGDAFLNGAIAALLYLAVEPFVRRHTP